jgi:hypothetical protein
MATINEVLASNPHKDAFDSLIQYLNENQNPFEAALAANMMYTRLTFWGAASIPGPPPPKYTPSGMGNLVNNTNYQVQPQVAKVVIRQAAFDAGVDDPLSADLLTFQNYLDQLDAGLSNAWIDFNLAINVFYEVIDPISYFINDYMQGGYAELFIDMLGLYARPGAQLNGLGIMRSVDDININYNAAVASKLNSRSFSLYDELDTEHLFWFNFMGTGTPPQSATATLHEIAIDDITKAEIQTATDAIIEIVAKWTRTKYDDLISTWVLDAVYDATPPDNGTAGTYNNGITSMVSAYDASVIDGNIDVMDFILWQNTNNSMRAVYDEAFDMAFYLDTLNENSLFNITKNPALQAVYRFFPYNIEVAQMGYNLPGTIFQLLAGKTRDKNI